MTACRCPSDRTAFSSFTGKTASQAQNEVDHFNIHIAQQGGGAKPCQVNQSKHPHLSVLCRRTKKKILSGCQQLSDQSSNFSHIFYFLSFYLIQSYVPKAHRYIFVTPTYTFQCYVIDIEILTLVWVN